MTVTSNYLFLTASFLFIFLSNLIELTIGQATCLEFLVSFPIDDPDLVETDFSGSFIEGNGKLYDSRFWRAFADVDKEVYRLNNDWVIQSDTLDTLVFDDSSLIYTDVPPQGSNSWVHGSYGSVTVTTDCSITNSPSNAPSIAPTLAPINNPTSTPTNAPTFSPTDLPTTVPTDIPSLAPTYAPTVTCEALSLDLDESTLSFYDTRRRLSDHVITDSMHDWYYYPNGDFNNRPSWKYTSLDGDIESTIYYSTLSTPEWTIDVIDGGNLTRFKDTSKTQSKYPPFDNTWEAGLEVTIATVTTNTVSATINLQCYDSEPPSDAPTTSPTDMPSPAPTVAPTSAPTLPTDAPTSAPTDRCDELYVYDTNETFPNGTLNPTLSIKFNGLFIQQSSFSKDNRPWFALTDNTEIWIYYTTINSIAGWYFHTGSELIYYQSTNFEPPIDSETGSDDGVWWDSDTPLNDGSGKFKQYKISLECEIITEVPSNNPTNEPTERPSTTTTEEPEGPSSTEELEEIVAPNTGFLGLNEVEWFFIVFVIVLIGICGIVLYWYREIKKASMIKDAKRRQGISALDDDDDNDVEIVGGINRRSQAPNSPHQKASFAQQPAEGNEVVSGASNDAFQSALRAATKQRSQGGQ